MRTTADHLYKRPYRFAADLTKPYHLIMRISSARLFVRRTGCSRESMVSKWNERILSARGMAVLRLPKAFATDYVTLDLDIGFDASHSRRVFLLFRSD
jgi:hypothetical protein